MEHFSPAGRVAHSAEEGVQAGVAGQQDSLGSIPPVLTYRDVNHQLGEGLALHEAKRSRPDAQALPGRRARKALKMLEAMPAQREK